MRRTPLVSACVIASVVTMTAALATPPVGDIKATDFAHAQTIEGAVVPISIHSMLVSGMYSVAPGGDTGWRRLPGTMVLSVTKGKAMVHGGEGCAAKEYGPAQAAVVPAGLYQVRNAGREPLEFFGVFFDQASGAPQALAEGPTEAVPADCSGVTATAAPSGVSFTSPAAGAFIPAVYNSTVEVEAGLDTYAARFEFGPGASSGWISHRPAVGIVESGVLTYVEGKDGKCDSSEVYNPGESFSHPAHRHMAVNEGKEPLLITVVFFNLPHETPLPAVGNQLHAVDGSQLPPAECPRLK